MSNFGVTSQSELISRFGLADYCVFGLMLAISAGIGIYYATVGGKQNTTAEFLLGNRSLGVIPVALSLLSSFISAIALLGIPAEVYIYGLQFWSQVLLFPLVMFIAAYFFIPVFYELGLTSSYEYLERRFGRSLRVIASVLFCFHILLYMAVVLYAPALALSQVTGVSVWFSVLSTGLVCTFYTTIGGIKAVVWTDVFQCIMMMGASIVVIVKGIVDVGGPMRVWEINQKYNRIEVFNMNPDPLLRHTFWTVVIGSTFSWTAIYGTNQAMVQRYLAIPTLAKAKRAVWVVLPLKMFIITLTCGGGLVAFAKYYDCDPVVTRRVSAPDQIYPLFVMDILGFFPGFPGLFVAGVFSGALSTISSGVNSLAAVTLEDFVKTFLVKNITETKALYLTKALAIFYGLTAVGLVAVAAQLGNILQTAILVGGLLGSPMLGLFVLGMFFPAANKKGALYGAIAGISASLWIGVGSLIYKPYYAKKPISVDSCLDLYSNVTGKAYDELTFTDYYASRELLRQNDDIPTIYFISYMYYSVIGCITTIVVGYLSSLATGQSDLKSLDPRLFTPCIQRWLEEKQNDRMAQIVSKSETRNGTELMKVTPIEDTPRHDKSYVNNGFLSDGNSNSIERNT